MTRKPLKRALRRGAQGTYQSLNLSYPRLCPRWRKAASSEECRGEGASKDHARADQKPRHVRDVSNKYRNAGGGARRQKVFGMEACSRPGRKVIA